MMISLDNNANTVLESKIKFGHTRTEMSGYGSIYDKLYFSGGSRGGAQGDQLSLSQGFEDRPPLPPPYLI